MSFMDGVVDRAYNSGARKAKQQIVRMLEGELAIANQYGKPNAWVIEKVIEKVKELEVEKLDED